ncbi:MAG: hypothetical protein OEM80_09880, partial [Desulfobulbaceae bacterium]|nr:hypothetical protein [Desulfobulbaceae bacterium]
LSWEDTACISGSAGIAFLLRNKPNIHCSWGTGITLWLKFTLKLSGPRLPAGIYNTKQNSRTAPLSLCTSALQHIPQSKFSCQPATSSRQATRNQFHAGNTFKPDPSEENRFFRAYVQVNIVVRNVDF